MNNLHPRFRDDTLAETFQELLTRREEEFAEAYEVKRSGSLHACFRRIALGRCHLTSCAFDPGEGLGYPVWDHPTVWIGKDKRAKILTLEPYGWLDEEHFAQLFERTKKWGLQATIDARSWHYPGKTLLIKIMKGVA